MLSLKPPFLEAGNLTIFRDDVDGGTFYYACQQPSIMYGDDGRPQIAAYAILPESGVDVQKERILEFGLNLDVCLSPSEADLALAEDLIKKYFGTKLKKLAPAPLHNGTVRFIMAQAGEETNPSKWFITSEIRPSMVGNNKASLVLRASGKNAELMYAATASGAVPAAIYYNLELIGMTPVYHASMYADMRMVYHHFEKFQKDNYIFYSNQVESAVDDLHQQGAFRIEVEELDPDIKAEALKALLNELKTQVISTFFEPALPDAGKKASLADKIAGAASRLIDSIIPGRHYLKKQIDESQLKTFAVDLSQKNVKTYAFSPQALLSSMLKASGADVAEVIQKYSLDDLPVSSKEVEIRIAADTFDCSNINSVVVYCKVMDNDSGDVIKDPDCITFDNKNQVFSHKLSYNRKKSIAYRYAYRVEMFMATESNRLPNKLETEWRSTDSPFIYINPAEYYGNFGIDINLDDPSIFEFAHLIQADVDVIAGKDEELVLKRTFLFSKQETEHKQLSIVADRNADLRYNLSLTYFISESKDLRVLLKDVKGNIFFIPNPFENRWSVDLHCQTDWNLVSKVYLDIRIQDAERQNPILNHFCFTAGTTDQKLDAACSLNTENRVFDYLVTVLYADGRQVRAGWYRHNGDPMLVIFADKLMPERIIRMKILNKAYLSSKNIESVRVYYQCEGREELKDFLSQDDTVEFKQEGKVVHYAYKISVKGKFGERYKSKKWIESNLDDLLITIPENIW